MQESEAIRLATPLLQNNREGFEFASRRLMHGETVVREDGPPRALFCSRSNPRLKGFERFPPDHDFWFVILDFEARYKPGSVPDSVACKDRVLKHRYTVLIDDVTGEIEDFYSL